MGGSASAQLTEWNPATLLESIPYGIGEHPSFWCEKYIELFQDAPEAISPIKQTHSPQNLSLLLSGCYEQLDNKQDILECIITGDLDDPAPYIDYLTRIFENHLKLAIIRSSMSMHDLILVGYLVVILNCTLN